ncbi:hypothetical protein PV704_35505, partial [Streptomyces scabiei]|nr:hypothetical protein [Streptomyces scabiei]
WKCVLDVVVPFRGVGVVDEPAGRGRWPPRLGPRGPAQDPVQLDIALRVEFGPYDGGAGADGGDEATTRLRVSPTPRYGRQVGPRPAHSRTAVVRTELHPQGYVELDRVLRRAVWAEPGRPPPAPGGLVDVTDARERDSDVLYAFPPTAARHAKGTPR